MTSLHLLRRSLLYYWRTNLAVVLGVVTATAVIGGALIVGDSVRDSLRQMSLDRLGGIDHAFAGHRFFREQLAQELKPDADSRHFNTVAPAIVMQAGLLLRGDTGAVSRAGNVNVYAVDERLWRLTDAGKLPVPAGHDVVLNQRTADQLAAKVGDEISLVIEIPPSIPRDALLGDRDETVTELVLKVSGIAPDESGLGRLGLNPGQQLPLNAYVPLLALQRQLGLSEVQPTRRNPVYKPARVNALFVGDSSPAPPREDRISPAVAEELTRRIDRSLTLDDLSLQLTPHSDHGYLALESRQMILENAVADAARDVAAELGWKTSPVLVYLLNRMGTEVGGRRSEVGGQEAGSREVEGGYSMYSVVAGVDFDEAPPFGPFQFLAGGPPPWPKLPASDVPHAANNSPPTSTSDAGSISHEAGGISHGPIPAVLNEWLADDLDGAGGDGTLLPIGATFPVRYHVVGDRGDLPELERTFQVAGIVKLEGPAADRGLTPEVEGVTDVETYGDWREPFPLDHDAITDRDDAYWKAHRATPKVFLRLADAQALWQSRYGKLTTFRVAPPADMPLDEAAALFSAKLLEHLGPDQTGLILQPVKHFGLVAAAGTTDFTGLFIGFSFFLIVAAMLLIGLLFRLGIERRVRELGLLAAVGLPPRRVRRVFLLEGLLLATVGGLLGIPAAIGYARLMVFGLTTWWRGAIGTQFLFVSVRPAGVAAGFAAGLFVAVLAIAWALRQTRRLSSRELLSGVTEPEGDFLPSPSGRGAGGEGRESTAKALTLPSPRGRGFFQGRLARRIATIALPLALLLLVVSLADLVPASEAFSGFSWQVVAFFVSGIAALTGSLALLAAWLSSDRTPAVRGTGPAAVARLALRNAARHRTRSVLTASLIASAAFVLVAIAAGHRNPVDEAPVRGSGNGGFVLVAETSQPVLYDLNTPDGRTQLSVRIEDPADRRLIDAMRVTPFRVRAGEDASCLNLYATRLPTILGVPDDVIAAFDEQGRFKFADTPSEHPWRLLRDQLPGGRIPVFGDMNTVMYSLHLGLGGEVDVPKETLTDAGLDGAALQIAGMLDGSIFQGVLLMSESNFHRLFPRQAGFRYFLIEAPLADADALAGLLESQLSDSGFDAERVSRRLQDFLAVQNTYLLTFQTLGGLGLLLGTIGLATVMLRNVLERRSELALLRAVGLTRSSVSLLVLVENAFLLACGLAAGTLSALLAMTPHLASTGAQVPWLSLQALVAGVFVVGMLAALAAVREAVRTPILATLRAE